MVKQKSVLVRAFPREFLIQAIAVGVFIIGLVATLGWIFNLASFRQVVETTISMKFTTAICVVLSGVLLYLFSFFWRAKNRTAWQVVIFNASIFLLLLMGTMTAAMVVGVSTGIENIIVKEKPGAVKTHFLGAPSIFTAIAFTLFAFVGLIFAFDLSKTFAVWLGAVIFLIGAVALLGYLFDIPQLYYDFPKITNPIAINTAVAFSLMGIGLMLIPRGKNGA